MQWHVPAAGAFPVSSSPVLSVLGVLGGGGVCGCGVVWQGAPAANSRPTAEQVLKLSGHAAGKRRVDPRVGARIQAGQQHQDGEGHAC